MYADTNMLGAARRGKCAHSCQRRRELLRRFASDLLYGQFLARTIEGHSARWTEQPEPGQQRLGVQNARSHVGAKNDGVFKHSLHAGIAEREPVQLLAACRRR